MDIAEQDKKIILLKMALDENQKFIIYKLKKLKVAQKENEFLKTIYDDYKKFFDFIIEQKQKQREQLEFLAKYLEKSIIDAGVSKSMLRNAKREQNNILSKLDAIRLDLETMTEE